MINTNEANKGVTNGTKPLFLDKKSKSLEMRLIMGWLELYHGSLAIPE